MDKIRWGIMGAGRISGWFSTGLKTAEGAELYAVASRTKKKAHKFADEFGYGRYYGSYEDMLMDENVDVVYIGTPVSAHYECIKMCLEAGKHVLCEKAFTVNAAQAREVRDIAAAKGLFLMEAMWMKCLPINLQLRQWAEEGVFGDIRAVESAFYTKADSHHRLYNKSIAGGALLDIIIYSIAQACMMLGHSPEEIISSAVICQEGVDEMATITLKYPGGKFASISGGMAPERITSLYIQGTKGRLLVNKESFHDMQYAEILDRDNMVTASAGGGFIANGYEFEAIEVMDCIRRGDIESKKVPLDETIAVLDIMDECRRQWGLRYDCE